MASNTYSIPAESRTTFVPKTITVVVDPESRTKILPSEIRSVVVDPESRKTFVFLGEQIASPLSVINGMAAGQLAAGTAVGLDALAVIYQTNAEVIDVGALALDSAASLGASAEASIGTAGAAIDAAGLVGAGDTGATATALGLDTTSAVFATDALWNINVDSFALDAVALTGGIANAQTATVSAVGVDAVVGAAADVAPVTAAAQNTTSLVSPVDTGATATAAAQNATVTVGATDPVWVKDVAAQSAASTTTVTCTLASAPTAGNLLIFAMAGDKNTGALTLSGFTQLFELLSASVSLYVYYKVSAGTETSISPTWATSSPAGNCAWYAEYGSPATSNTWSICGSASNITDEATVLTKGTGTTGSTTHAGLGLAFAAVDSSQSVTTVSTWGNSYAVRYSATGLAGRGAIFVAEKLEANAVTTNSTFTYTGTADQVSAAIAVVAEV